METYPRIDSRIRALNKAPRYYTAFDPTHTRCASLQGEVIFSTLHAQLTLRPLDNELIPEDGAGAVDDRTDTEADDGLDVDDADEFDEDEDVDEDVGKNGDNDGEEDESDEGDDEKDIAGVGNSGDDDGDLEGGEEIDEEEDDAELDDHEPDDEFDDEDDDDDEDEYGSDWDEDDDNDEYDDDDELKSMKPSTLQEPYLFLPSSSQEAKPASPSRMIPNPTGQGQEYIGFEIT